MKKLLCFLMITAMILTTTLCAVNADNGMSEWAAAEIEEAVELGIVAENLQKDYQKNITREEFAVTAMIGTVFARALEEFRIVRAAVSPFITGICIYIRIASKCGEFSSSNI